MECSFGNSFEAVHRTAPGRPCSDGKVSDRLTHDRATGSTPSRSFLSLQSLLGFNNVVVTSNLIDEFGSTEITIGFFLDFLAAGCWLLSSPPLHQSSLGRCTSEIV